MNYRAPAIISILLMGGLLCIYAVTSWSLQPWGPATIAALTVILGVVGAALSLRMYRKQQH